MSDLFLFMLFILCSMLKLQPSCLIIRQCTSGISMRRLQEPLHERADNCIRLLDVRLMPTGGHILEHMVVDR